ncbi:hypothetical protein [Massilia cavernae]|uniref:Uncharacterized protein n=1 Tax=Massilia cavernae TaxID=2320864 RepID=A0A418Y6Y5_9BURK|nr:hypothetical protein [Massilia cavernae]RJG24684.1 hypothetical protein D3872_03400 [Massilia cavernae]
MFSNGSSLRSAVFRKTEKGRAELAKRKLGLGGKQRGVLIMLDGRKRLSDIETLFNRLELEAVVALLIQLDLIEASGDGGPAEVLVPTEAAPAAHLLTAKQMMIKSANEHIGLMAAELIARIENSRDQAQLLSVVGHWSMAMHASKTGKLVASLQLEQVKECIQNPDYASSPLP